MNSKKNGEKPPNETSRELLGSLVDLEALELPVRVCKGCWIVRHIIRAGSWATRLHSVKFLQASQLTAEIYISNNTLIAEVRTDIAVGAGEVSQCSSPRRGVRSGIRIGDIVRDGRTREEPDTDTSISQLRCVDL